MKSEDRYHALETLQSVTRAIRVTFTAWGWIAYFGDGIASLVIGFFLMALLLVLDEVLVEEIYAAKVVHEKG